MLLKCPTMHGTATTTKRDHAQMPEAHVRTQAVLWKEVPYLRWPPMATKLFKHGEYN